MIQIIILLLLKHEELCREKELNVPFLCSHNAMSTYLLVTHPILLRAYLFFAHH